MAVEIENLRSLRDWIGRETVPEWLSISQARIQSFADVTEDHQWIHLNVRVANLPLGPPSHTDF